MKPHKATITAVAIALAVLFTGTVALAQTQTPYQNLCPFITTNVVEVCPPADPNCTLGWQSEWEWPIEFQDDTEYRFAPGSYPGFALHNASRIRFVAVAGEVTFHGLAFPIPGINNSGMRVILALDSEYIEFTVEDSGRWNIDSTGIQNMTGITGTESGPSFSFFSGCVGLTAMAVQNFGGLGLYAYTESDQSPRIALRDSKVVSCGGNGWGVHVGAWPSATSRLELIADREDVSFLDNGSTGIYVYIDECSLSSPSGSAHIIARGNGGTGLRLTCKTWADIRDAKAENNGQGIRIHTKELYAKDISAARNATTGIRLLLDEGRVESVSAEGNGTGIHIHSVGIGLEISQFNLIGNSTGLIYDDPQSVIPAYTSGGVLVLNSGRVEGGAGSPYGLYGIETYGPTTVTSASISEYSVGLLSTGSLANLAIEASRFDNCLEKAILVHTSPEVVINNVAVVSANTGVSANRFDTLSITSSTFEDVIEGVSVSDGAGGAFVGGAANGQGNVFRGRTKTALVAIVGRDTGYLEVVKNTIEGFEEGVNIVGTASGRYARGYLDSNFIKDVRSSGISIRNADNCVLTNNIVSGVASPGADLDSCGAGAAWGTGIFLGGNSPEYKGGSTNVFRLFNNTVDSVVGTGLSVDIADNESHFANNIFTNSCYGITGPIETSYNNFYDVEIDNYTGSVVHRPPEFNLPPTYYGKSPFDMPSDARLTKGSPEEVKNGGGLFFLHGAPLVDFGGTTRAKHRISIGAWEEEVPVLWASEIEAVP